MGKSAVQKRDLAPAPHVEQIAVAKGPGYPPGRMLVASPLEVQAIVQKIPPGRVLRLGDLRSTLAAKFQADYTCAMTTGIFLRIVAEAAAEERGRAGPEVPTWRVVRDDGELLDKLPGGAEAQAGLLAREGVSVLHLGKRAVISSIEHFAWTPPPQRRRSAQGGGPGRAPQPGPAPARPATASRRRRNG